MLYSKNKKRGFTLVELIVVLVILAILAALLIPALTGYIDKAKKDQVIAETRMLHEAVQTEMSELYGSANWKLNSATTLANNTGKVIGNNPNGYDLKANYDKIAKLSEVPCLQEGGSGHFLVLINSKAQIHAIIYHSDRGYLGLYFSDTNQYSAYKIGETAEGGKISDNMFRSYYSSVYYNTSVDAVPTPTAITKTTAVICGLVLASAVCCTSANLFSHHHNKIPANRRGFLLPYDIMPQTHQETQRSAPT